MFFGIGHTTMTLLYLVHCSKLRLCGLIYFTGTIYINEMATIAGVLIFMDH